MNAHNKNKNRRLKVVTAKHEWWRNPFIKMVFHVLATTVVAVVIGLAAFGLNLFADWLQAHHASHFLVHVFHLFENTLLVIDVVWAVLYIIYGIIKEFFIGE